MVLSLNVEDLYQRAKLDFTYSELLLFFANQSQLFGEFARIRNNDSNILSVIQSVLVLYYKVWFLSLKANVLSVCSERSKTDIQYIHNLFEIDSFLSCVNLHLSTLRSEIANYFHSRDNEMNNNNNNNVNIINNEKNNFLQFIEEKPKIVKLLQLTTENCISFAMIYERMNSNQRNNILHEQYHQLKEWNATSKKYSSSLSKFFEANYKLASFRAQYSKITPKPSSLHYNTNQGIKELNQLLKHDPKLIFQSINSKNYTIFHWICEKGNVDLVSKSLHFITNNFSILKQFNIPSASSSFIVANNILSSSSSSSSSLSSSSSSYDKKSDFNQIKIKNDDSDDEEQDEIIERWSPLYLIQYLYIVVGEDENNLNNFKIKQNKIKTILSFNIDINSTISKTKKTALQMAVEKNLFQTTKLLIDLNASVDPLPAAYSSPIHSAVLLMSKRNDQTEEEDTRILQLLINSKCNINIVDCNNQTALHVAVQHQRFKMVKLLLSCNNLNLDAQDSDGNTALHFAVTSQNIDIISALLKSNAKTHLTNTNNDTPLLIASQLYCQNQSDKLLSIVQILDESLSSIRDSNLLNPQLKFENNHHHQLDSSARPIQQWKAGIIK